MQDAKGWYCAFVEPTVHGVLLTASGRVPVLSELRSYIPQRTKRFVEPTVPGILLTASDKIPVLSDLQSYIPQRTKEYSSEQID